MMKIFHNVHGWINGEIPKENEEYHHFHGGKLVDGVLVGAGGHTHIYTTVIEVVKIRKITAEAMRNRFTFDERVLIDSSLHPRVKTFRNDLAAKTTPVNLDSVKIGYALDLLEAENCLILLGGKTIQQHRTKLLADGKQDEV
ncbi:MAG: hypothetical protein ACI9LM_000102 [Alteromonadaceae bacterium]|jgi:hypothetical protein